MNRTTEIVLEYLSPKLAAEMMVRIHVSLPEDPRESTRHLNEVHRELRKAQSQVTSEGFQAPEGKYRLMRKEMSDGKLSIVADYTHNEFACIGLESARTTHPNDVFTLCDDKGPLKD